MGKGGAMPGDPQDPRGPEPAAPCDDVRAQHARIVACLKARGRLSRRELESACDVPSVTKRVCELIAAGWPIERTRGHERTRQGARRRATFYALSGPHAQGDLFGDPA